MIVRSNRNSHGGTRKRLYGRKRRRVRRGKRRRVRRGTRRRVRRGTRRRVRRGTRRRGRRVRRDRIMRLLSGKGIKVKKGRPKGRGIVGQVATLPRRAFSCIGNFLNRTCGTAFPTSREKEARMAVYNISNSRERRAALQEQRQCLRDFKHMKPHDQAAVLGILEEAADFGDDICKAFGI